MSGPWTAIAHVPNGAICSTRPLRAKTLSLPRYGKPVTAMISYEDYVALLDELDDLRSTRRAGAVIADLEAGRTTTRPLDEIKAELKAEGLLDD